MYLSAQLGSVSGQPNDSSLTNKFYGCYLSRKYTEGASYIDQAEELGCPCQIASTLELVS